MDRQASLWERRTETAGWLGVRVRHNAGLEGELAVRRNSPSLGSGLLLCLGAAALLGVK